MNEKIVDIKSRIDLVADRIAWIDQRSKEIKASMNQLQVEANALWSERQNLEDAGKTLRALLDKPAWR